MYQINNDYICYAIGRRGVSLVERIKALDPDNALSCFKEEYGAYLKSLDPIVYRVYSSALEVTVVGKNEDTVYRPENVPCISRIDLD